MEHKHLIENCETNDDKESWVHMGANVYINIDFNKYREPFMKDLP